MLKKVSIYLSFFIFLTASFAEAKGTTFHIFPSGVTVIHVDNVRDVDSGGSVFFVDTHSGAYGPLENGNFSFQFTPETGITCGHTDDSGVSTLAVSGASATVYYVSLDELPSGVNAGKAISTADVPGWSNMDWKNLVSGIAHDTGNSTYVYDFFPKKARYVGIRFETGVTDMYFDPVLDMD